MFMSPDDNPASSFLRQSALSDPIALFRAYAHYLIDSVDGWELPVPITVIAHKHKLCVKKAALGNQRGMIFGNSIVVNGDDLATTQAFSLAHELMELLVRALRAEQIARFSTVIQAKFEALKEGWCELGAAELLMPEPLFAPLAAIYGVSLAAGGEVATVCQTSLTATVRRLVDTDLAPCIFVHFKPGYRKSQAVPSQSGQGVLWGAPEEWDPPAELRVLKWWRASQVTHRLYNNKSIPRHTMVYETFETGIPGQINHGNDRLEFPKFPELVRTESMLVRIDGDLVVMAMLHL